MDLNKKKFIDNFINKEDEYKESFNLVLEKLNELFVSILNDISNKLDNKVSFKINLIGEHFLSSHFSYNNQAHILIDYITNEEDIEFTQKRSTKSDIGKLYADAFNSKNNVILTINELTKVFYNELAIRTKNASLYFRKNQISLKFLDYKFFVFFINKTILKNNYNFQIKGKNFNLNINKTNENLLKKNAETKGNFFNLIKLYKVIELELISLNKLNIFASKTPYFYENLLYNIPNELLTNESVFDNLLASLSYLVNNNIKEFTTADDMSLVDDSYKLYSKPSITTLDVNKVIKQTQYFILNIDKILAS